MIVVNMWFIKHSNGLFHYGLDYAEALGSSVREVWVRNAALARAVSVRLPAADVRVFGRWQLFSGMFRVRRHRDLLFTPSPHPMPLWSRQVVVLHDSFPFMGGRGAIKLGLFRFGLALSRSSAAYINQANGLAFLKLRGLGGARAHYLPNRIEGPLEGTEEGGLILGGEVVVGLFGTDSPKKNYDALFQVARASEQNIPVSWRIYGHPNEYTNRLRAAYPELSIEIVASDGMSMREFIRSIDIAVSVAEGEGFARPVALALMSGTPTLLLDTPVFREFYGNSAHIFETPEALVAALGALRTGRELERPQLKAEDQLRRDFNSGVAWLKAR